MKHGHFFKFVAQLLSYEYEESRAFAKLFESGGTSKVPQRRNNKVIELI